MPRYPALTPAQEKKVTELVSLLEKTYNPLPPHLQSIQQFMTGDGADTSTPLNPIREYCYCFLISREWNLHEAFEMLQLAVDYRGQNQLDTRAEFPSALSCKGWDQDEVRRALGKEARSTDQRLDRLCAGIAPFFSYGFHKWDKFGQPVLYMAVGSIDEAGLLKKLRQMANVGQSGEAVMWEVVQHSLGIDEQLQYYQQLQYNAGALKVDAADGLIRSTTLVIDLKGLTYKMLWKPALDLFMNTLREIFKYYSQCVYQILIVNSPAMVMFAYKIVRGVLPPGVQQKVHIVNAQDTNAAIRKFIDEVNIPDVFGGTCHCPGGCIEGYDPAHRRRKDKESVSSTSEAASNDATGVATEDISLKAGQQHKRVFSLNAGESVVWEFVSSDGTDVTFVKCFVPEKAAKEMNWERVSVSKLEMYVVSRENPSEGSDEYTATANGVLVLVWDNKKSWFTAKHLQMKLFKQAPEQSSP
ncbi:hypothetical protein ABB37_05868 [Leptomonas pyrrhocoris]|uniref:CRAL-TRIO domain-containing protein n=1 Tax=Leptomonas pyrrhocoris TaxID=157538 RepID=A0A0M9FYJ2_LEPPY|nr:hypothetical protein ABB37_05868 [Leptomonas pyrrhocoris]KPA78750.1 hypothetical protein ABB37_05868 [Leptomonas pyrrhocoris]|eukprot:XP_015657189.1 hypothetical protein ABB37_05868 [Leptomonas pyrrhocoris]